MSHTPCETTEVHTRLLKCALVDEASAIYWRNRNPADAQVDPVEAHRGFWFGDRSLPRVRELLINFRARFDAFPDALAALHAWHPIDPRTRAQICHLHLALTDPLYRAFTADFLPQRHLGMNTNVRRDQVVDFVGDHGPGRWTMSTRIQFASKLLSCATGAGLVQGRVDPRSLVIPRITDDALTYTLYLLRHTQFEGTLLANAYLRSMGLYDEFLTPRLHTLRDVRIRQLGSVVEIDWAFDGLYAWVRARHAEDAA